MRLYQVEPEASNHLQSSDTIPFSILEVETARVSPCCLLFQSLSSLSLALVTVAIVRDNEGLQQYLRLSYFCCSCPVTSNIVCVYLSMQALKSI